MSHHPSDNTPTPQPSLEDILDNFGYEVVGHSPEARTMLISMAKRRITALIATAKPRKIAGCSEHGFGSEDCKRWFECPKIAMHNQAIDKYEASLLRKLEGEG